MNVSRELLFFISTLGWFNGFLLAIYFLFFYKNRTTSAIMFGLMLLALSIRVAKSVLWWFNPTMPVIVVLVGLVACMFIGPLLYYYVKASVLGLRHTPKKWKITLAAYVILGLLLLVFFSTKPYRFYWANYIIPCIFAQWFIYVLFAGYTLKDLFAKAIAKGKKLKPNDKWVLAIYLGNFMIAASYALAFPGIKVVSYITGSIAFSIILYLNVLILIYRKKTDDLFQSEPEKYANKKIDTSEATILVKQLEKLMAETSAYTKADLKLNDLATQLQISGHQLSQLLNDNLGKNFTSYINDYRIRKACEIIMTTNNLKLEAVGYEVGFNSKSTFFAAFKKFTGTTPKLYKEQLVSNN
jgi:AraC-like DNA-binding protein